MKVGAALRMGWLPPPVSVTVRVACCALLAVLLGIPTASLAQSAAPAPLSPLSIAYHRLRIAYSTTSDWATLEFRDTRNVLTMRLVQKLGNPTNVEIRPQQLGLNQPLADSRRGRVVGVSVDYALSPQAPLHLLPLVLRKGDIGKSTLRVFSITDGQPQLLREITHQGVVADSGGLNPLSIQIDLSQLKGMTPLQAQIKRRTRKMLWAFYYPWYRLSHWSSPQLRDRPQTPYASNDPEAIARQIGQAQQAGIDGFISSWWGPGHYTDGNLEILLRLAQEKGFSVSVYFETLTDRGPRDGEEILRWLAYAIDKYGRHPAFFGMDGKPVIIIWASGAVPLGTWQSIFSRLRKQGKDAVFLGMGYDVVNLAVFDGIHDYAVFTIPNLAEVYQGAARATRSYLLLTDPPNEVKLWVATVQPGNDDRLIPGRKGLFQDRQDGKFYRSTFEAALQSDPDWIFITTWNEWWEHTYIEPSELYGDFYLRITREFAQRWKASR